MHRHLASLVLAAALAACTSSGSSGGGGPAKLGTEPMASAGSECTQVLTRKVSGAEHRTAPEQISYPDEPPTGGPHWGAGFIRGGRISETPIEDEIAVHNLEHGYVVVQYNDVSAGELDAIRAPVQADPQQMILAPRPTLKSKLALTSWGKIQTCTVVPDDVGELIRSFVAANRGKAPENIP